MIGFEPNKPVTQLMLQTLSKRGVRAAFGLPGSLIAPLYDRLADFPEIRLVHTRHESMATFSAMGHAVVTGKPALVITTGGPGITNALTGVAAALAEGLPMIFIGGDVPTSSTTRAAIQDGSSNGIDAVALMRTVTRWSARLDDPAGVLGALEQAWAIATGPRPGPVFLSLPVDVSLGKCAPLTIALGTEGAPVGPDPQACSDVATHLHQAKKPLIIAGSGARKAASNLRLLAERTGCPVVVTPRSKGVFPDNHPLHLGGIGVGGHPSASDYLRTEPDVVCIIGSPLGDVATNSWSLPVAGTQATYQIDSDPWLVGRNYPVTLGLVGNVDRALASMVQSLPGPSQQPARKGGGIQWLYPESMTSDESPLTPARALIALQRAYPSALWTGDQGEHCVYALHYLQINDPEQFHAMIGFASMGSGIGIAIGASHALSDKIVFGLCGDGGMAMHIGELLTCVEHGINVVFVVFNDGRWNMVNHGLGIDFGRLPSEFPSHIANLAGVANELGAVGVRIEHPRDLEPEVLRSIIGRGRPVLLDIRIDPSRALSTASRAASVRDKNTRKFSL